MLETENLYHMKGFEDTYHCQAKIIRVSNDKVFFDKTIFYAESGGQEPDKGYLIINGNKRIEILDVQYEKGINQSTAHYISENEANSLSIGSYVDLYIDSERRKKLSAHHTASHLLFIAVEQVRSGIQKNVIGCHIKEDNARFDFITDTKFSSEELSEIQKIINSMIEKNINIDVYFEDINSNKRLWKCGDYIIPCGGTHLNNTCLLSEITVKRKGIGKGKERIICLNSNNNILRGI